MPGGRFGCPDGKSDTTAAAVPSGGSVHHQGYQPGDASHFLASAYSGPQHSSVGYRHPSVLHPPHYGDPQSGLMSYFSEAAVGLQNSFMGSDALSKQSNAADYSTSSSGEGKGGHSPSPSPFSLQRQQLQQQHLHQLHMIQQQQRLHQQQQQSQLQRQQILSNLNLSGLHQGVSQERASSSSNQYCKPINESEGRTFSRDISRNLVNNLTDPYHPRKRYHPNDEGNKHYAYNPKMLLESNLMQRIGQSVMSCAMKDLVQCASSSKAPEFSSSQMKVENLTRTIPVSANSPSDDSKPCVLSGYREQNLTPTREDLICHDLPLETTLHEGEEYHSSIDGDKGMHHNKLLSPLLGDDLIHQGGRTKIYECSLCTFTCRKQTDLVSHVTIHPDEKPFHCKQCEYKGAKYHYLRNHLLTHSQRPLLSCTECEYKCYQNGALKVHMRRHTDEKRYACTTCHYRTHFMGNLKLHLRVHTGEKPYACSVCDFRCTQSGSLKIHMRGHSGEKPYSCDICEYRSKHKGNLVMHRRKHTGDKPYHCDQCNYKAAQRMALTKHNKTVHGLISSPPSVHQPSDTTSDLSIILHRKGDQGFIGPMTNDSPNSPALSEQEAPLHPKHELLEQPSLSLVSTPSLRYPYYDQNLTERKPLSNHFQEPWKLNNLKQSEIAEDEQSYKGNEEDPLYVCGDMQNKHVVELQNDTDSER